MTDNPFPPEIRTAAIVPRWSVVWTLNKDTVAAHSYFVAVYSYQIADLIKWDGDRARLLFLALTHDLDETVTGDIVSPVKRAIVDVDRARSYIGPAMLERMPSIWNKMMKPVPGDDGAFAIIECADRLDALLFLTVEQRMGNRHIFNRCQDAYDRFMDAWRGLPAKEQTLQDLYRDVIMFAINEHRRLGSNGI